MKLKHSAKLILRMLCNCGNISSILKRKTGHFLVSRLREDGVFIDSTGFGDLYNTAKAVQAFHLIQYSDGRYVQRAGDFLSRALVSLAQGKSAFVTDSGNGAGLYVPEILALVFAANLLEYSSGRNVFAEAKVDPRQFVLKGLCSLRREDGGLASSSEARVSSLLATGMGLTCIQIAGIAPYREHEDFHALLESIVASRQSPTGGYFDLVQAPMVTATASFAGRWIRRAVAEEREFLGHPSPAGGELFHRNNTFAFFTRMRKHSGGYRPSAYATRADLMSTFYAVEGLAELLDWRWECLAEREKTSAFIRSCQRPDGGFADPGEEPISNIASTVYALSVLSLLGENR